MILTISRAEHFSPNSVAKDAAILECLGRRLRQYGFDVETVSEEDPMLDATADVYVSMSRSREAAALLRQKRQEGAIVVAPSLDAPLLTSRNELERVLRSRGVAVKADADNGAYWVKRTGGYTESEADIVYAPDHESMERALRQMRERYGQDGAYVSPHIEGDALKFYGVEGTGFFRTYYPADDGEEKFSYPTSTGKARHYAFDAEALQEQMDSLARQEGITFYGGDCIVSPDGTPYVIDLNDWPSYSRCREEAAGAMAKVVIREIVRKKLSDSGRRLDIGAIKGLIFDYGGTLDTGGDHWGKVIWRAYERLGVGVDEATFRDAYVYAERQLGKNPIIRPTDTFRETLSKKLDIELAYIEGVKEGFRAADHHDALLSALYKETLKHTSRSLRVLRQIKKETGLRMVLVSNFYGNISTVLSEMGLESLFDTVVESAVVGIRKPDPRIFTLGVEALGLMPEETLVVGDSYEKDIVPGRRAGCQTLWIMGEGWTASLPDGLDANEVANDISAVGRLLI